MMWSRTDLPSQPKAGLQQAQVVPAILFRPSSISLAERSSKRKICAPPQFLKLKRMAWASLRSDSSLKCWAQTLKKFFIISGFPKHSNQSVTNGKALAWIYEPLKAVFGIDSLTAYRRSILWE
jgi:hypothetical protein